MDNSHRRLSNLGDKGEIIARDYLEKKGYLFVGSHYHSRYGELDLILWDGEELVFVEVKLRKNAAFGRGEESVTDSKARKLVMTANEFLDKNKLDHVFWRIDIVSIEKQGSDWVLFHFPDAVRDVEIKTC